MSLPKYGDSPYFGIFILKINNDILKINNDIMTLYSKWFDTHNEYETYKNGQDYILPNVSICNTDLHVHYEKKYDPYNGHEYVDLGLPSGTLWAKCNVGAETETDYGQYFQWGDTQGYTADQVGTDEGQKAFSWNDYKFGHYTAITKYNESDGKTILDLDDDAAHVNMGGEWRIPTLEQLQELLNSEYVTYQQVTNYKNSGVNGILFTSVTNSNTMFVPKSSASNGLINTTNTTLWSLELCDYSDSNAYGLYIDYRDICAVESDNARCYGYSVRGVVG